MTIKVGTLKGISFDHFVIIKEYYMNFYFILKDFLFLTTTADTYFFFVMLDTGAGETFSFV